MAAAVGLAYDDVCRATVVHIVRNPEKSAQPATSWSTDR